MKLHNRLKWCFRQKSGIRIIEPSNNLCEAYLKKANNSLKAMKVIGSDVKEWAIAAAYYARYHSIYALLMKCGIKSEIHDCTISLVKCLFSSEFSTKMIEDLENAKEQRINVQYYIDRPVKEEEFRKNIAYAPDFVLTVEKLIESVNNEKISEIRKNLKELKK